MSDWFDFPVAFQAQAWYCAVNPKPDLEMAGQGKGKGSGSGSGSGKGKGKGKGDDAPWYRSSLALTAFNLQLF